MNGTGAPSAVPAPAAQLPSLQASVAAFGKVAKEVKDEVVESDEFVDAMLLAIASRTHVYVAGEGGVGKTFGSEIMGKHFGVETFYTQFRNDTKREEVFGPLSMQALQADVYEHVTRGYLPEAVIANLDEFKDAGRFTRQLLNILNERWFVNGGKRLSVPLVTAIGTTNFWIEEQELDALFDRFAQRIVQEPVKTSRGFKKILKGQLARDADEANGIKREAKYTVVSPEHLGVVIAGVMLCRMEDGIVDLVDDLRKTAEKEKLTMSPRRWGEGIKLAKANAVLAGRDHVIEDDLRVYARVLRNHPDDFKVARDLTKAFRDKVSAAVEESASVLADIRKTLAPQRAKFDGGEQVDFQELTNVSKATNALRQKIEEAKRANSGRDLTSLESVEAELAGEEEWLMNAVLPGRRR